MAGAHVRAAIRGSSARSPLQSHYRGVSSLGSRRLSWHFRINSEIGTEEDFGEMAEKLGNYQMGLLLDIVPNHMAASFENPWWMDVLENGPASQFAQFFDIDWRPATTKAAFLQDNRVLLPMLSDLYGNVLDRGEMTVKIDDTGLFVRYFAHSLPLDPKTYDVVLEPVRQFPEIAELLAQVAELPDRAETDPERLQLRR